MIGKVIGNYEVVKELAQGGMGTVYHGRHLTLPREVAIKAITLSGFEPRVQEHLKARFLREAHIQSRLDHPNIVRVYEFFVTAENYYLVMEYVAGMSLHDLIERQGALPAAQAVRLIKQALAAMDYAHNFSYVDETGKHHAGIIHRDIKPGNMMLDGLARLKITDFGIVKVDDEQGLTQSGFNPGTVAYMSPEQIRGFALDARSDLYSLGVMFYQMLSGRLPFLPSPTGSDYEIRKGHIELEPPPLAELRPGIPPDLAEIVMHSLRKQPQERFQTAAEFLSAILHYESRLATLDQAAPNPLAGLTQAVKPTSTKAGQVQQTSETTVAQTVQSSAAARSAKPNVSTSAPTLLYQAAEPERRRGLLAGVVLSTVALAGAGAFFWMRQGNASPTNSNTQTLQSANTAASSTPLPTAAATSSSTVQVSPTATPAAQHATPSNETAASHADLNRAREQERQEHYQEAIKIYESYLQAHPRAADTGMVEDHLDQLRRLQMHLQKAELATQQKNYGMAFQEYRMVLDLNPESQIARAKMEELRPYLPRLRGNGPPPFRRPEEPPPPPGRRRQPPRPRPTVPPV